MPHSQSWIQWLGQGQSWISSREAQKQYWKKLRWMNHRDLIDFMAFWCDFNDCNGILIGLNDHEGILVIESGSYSLSTHFHKNVPQYSCMLIWLAPRMYVERGDRPTFFDHSFHRTSNRIETTCIIGHFTHFLGCWKFTQHYKGELTVRLVKDMSSITRTHSLLPKILGSAELAVQSQQSHSMMAQAMKYPNVSETKHILIILIVLYNSQGKIGKIDRYMYKNMIYDIWYIDGRNVDPNWASAAILSDRGWNLAFGRRELFNVSRHGSAFPRSCTFWNLPSSTVEKCVRMCWCWCILFELSEIPKHRKNNQKQQCAFLSLQSLEMLAHSRTRFLHCCDATQSVQWRGLAWSIFEKRCDRIDINITSNGMMCVLAGDNVIELFVAILSP